MVAADPRRIESWLDQLADLTVSGGEPVTSAKLATMAAMLAGDNLPNGAFCGDSLRAVAASNRFFPAYSDVSSALRNWWAQHRPPMPVLAGQNDSALDRKDRSWLVFWNTDRARILEREPSPGRDAELARLASLVRQQSPKAWAVIAGPDRGRPHPTADEINDVSAKLKAAFREMQADRPGARVETPMPAPSAVPLTDKHLAAVRAARSAP